MSVRAPMLLVAVLASILLAATVPSAAKAGGPLVWATTGSAGYRYAVCAQDLSVRSAPFAPGFAYLYRPQSFLVTGFSSVSGLFSEWVYGFAYGHVNRWGWVQNGWFC